MADPAVEVALMTRQLDEPDDNVRAFIDYATHLASVPFTLSIFLIQDGDPRPSADVIVELLDGNPPALWLFRSSDSWRGIGSTAPERLSLRNETERFRSAERIAKSIDEFCRERVQDLQAWNRSSEALIKRLSDLLEERDELREAYHKLYGDYRAADAKVTLLEAQLASLQAERNFTPERWRSPLVLATIALVIAGVLGPVLGSITSVVLTDTATKVVAQAQVVQNDCNITITNNNTTVNLVGGDVSITAPPASLKSQAPAGTVHTAQDTAGGTDSATIHKHP